MPQDHPSRTVGDLVEGLYERLMDEFGDEELAQLALATMITDLLHDQATREADAAAA